MDGNQEVILRRGKRCRGTDGKCDVTEERKSKGDGEILVVALTSFLFPEFLSLTLAQTEKEKGHWGCEESDITYLHISKK